MLGVYTVNLTNDKEFLITSSWDPGAEYLKVQHL